MTGNTSHAHRSPLVGLAFSSPPRTSLGSPVGNMLGFGSPTETVLNSPEISVTKLKKLASKAVENYKLHKAVENTEDKRPVAEDRRPVADEKITETCATNLQPFDELACMDVDSRGHVKNLYISNDTKLNNSTDHSDRNKSLPEQENHVCISSQNNATQTDIDNEHTDVVPQSQSSDPTVTGKNHGKPDVTESVRSQSKTLDLKPATVFECKVAETLETVNCAKISSASPQKGMGNDQTHEESTTEQKERSDTPDSRNNVVMEVAPSNSSFLQENSTPVKAGMNSSGNLEDVWFDAMDNMKTGNHTLHNSPRNISPKLANKRDHYLGIPLSQCELNYTDIENRKSLNNVSTGFLLEHTGSESEQTDNDYEIVEQSKLKVTSLGIELQNIATKYNKSSEDRKSTKDVNKSINNSMSDIDRPKEDHLPLEDVEQEHTLNKDNQNEPTGLYNLHVVIK